MYVAFFFFNHKMAYESRISDCSSDVCSSDLVLVVTLVAWDVASGWLIRPVLVSSPPEVAETLWRWIEEGTLWEHLWATTQAVIAGFLLEIGRASCRERVCQYV